jgi:hypothetical protein
VKVLRVLFDVYGQWDEVLVDKRGDFGVLIGLGFQPGTCTSGRCRAEIDKERFLLLFCRGESFVGVFDPIDGHR